MMHINTPMNVHYLLTMSLRAGYTKRATNVIHRADIIIETIIPSAGKSRC